MSTYGQFGVLLANARRAAGIAQQVDLALRLKVRQQTVSRWELGVSRPKAAEIPKIAAVLQCDADELLAAAGYANPSTPQVSFDQPWPADALAPASFERFCTDMVQLLYLDAEVHRYGDAGHKQDGIDLRAIHSDGRVFTFQCKRHSAFGPKKIEAAVRAHTQSADRKFIVISGLASPQSREAIRTFEGWELWDREDLSRRIRQHIPKVDQRKLVDTYFPGQALNLLGEPDPSPWRTPDDFFAPLSGTHRGFTHTWGLVGRTQDLDRLMAFAAQPSTPTQPSDPILFLVGNGGSGKSKLLYAFAERAKRELPGLKLYFLAREAISSKGLSLLGEKPKLLICDDAHDRDDLNLLYGHVADPKNNARLIVSLRKYGLERARRQAGFPMYDLPLIEIGKLPLVDSEALAREALQRFGGEPRHAERLASYTRDCPLATVIGAEILSKSTKALPDCLLGEDEFRVVLMDRLVTEIVTNVGEGLNERSVSQVLSSVSLLQPIRSDDPTLSQALGVLFDLQPNEIARILKRLKDAGVLFQRGSNSRIVPDLLGDFLIEHDCIVTNGQSTGFAERLFEAVPDAYAEHVLLNLGRMDWRKSNGDTRQSRALAGLWDRLVINHEYETPHTRAATAAAFYQPVQALRLVRKLIAEGRGGEPIARILRSVAYHFDHLAEACELLWKLGHNDARALNSHPSHAVRILSELAQPEPNKPIVYVDRLVDFALSLIDADVNWTGVYCPLDILSHVLATEGHTSKGNYREITMMPFLVRQQAMEAPRKKVIDACISLLTHADSSRAIRATASLHSALRYPMGLFNMRVDDGAYDQWTNEFCLTLTAINKLLDRVTLAPVVLLKLAEATSWHAQYAKNDATVPLAQKILDRLEADIRTQAVQTFFDGWGRLTTRVNGHVPWQERERDMLDFARSMLASHPKPDDLRDFVEGCLQEVAQARTKSDSSFMLMSQLIELSPPLAALILRDVKAGVDSQISRHAGTALARLLREDDFDARAFVAKAIEPDAPHLQIVGDAYQFRAGRGVLTAADRRVLTLLAASKDPRVLRPAITAAYQVAAQDRALAIELLSSVDYAVAPWIAHECLMWLCDERTLAFSSLSEGQVERILNKLKPLGDLSDHWIETFLKNALCHYPRPMLRFLMERFDDASRTNDWSFQPLPSGPYRNISMDFMALPDATILLTGLLDWGLEHKEDGAFSYRFGQMVEGLCAPFEGRFVAALETWMESGGVERFEFALPILREVPGNFVFEREDFVLRLFRRANSYGSDILRDLNSTLFSSAAYGLRSGTPGEPFPQDLLLRQSAESVVKKLGRFDPAYEFYDALIKHADREIEGQRREAADNELEDD